MAFTPDTFQKDGSNQNSRAPFLWSYRNTSDSMATIKGSGYFNYYIRALHVGDRIYVHASDAYGYIVVTSVTTNVTTADIS